MKSPEFGGNAPAPALAFGAVILAAGRSSRMGRPKLLLPWGSTSVLGHLVAQWRAVGAEQIAVVAAPGNQDLQTELDRLGFPRHDRVLNPAPERGMFSSIQASANWGGWRPGLAQIAIVLGDQPHLRSETLRQVLALAAAFPAKICHPSHNGRPRHPVILPQAALAALAASAASHLKEFLAGRESVVCEVEDPGLDLDLDRPEDYERALALVRPGSEPG